MDIKDCRREYLKGGLIRSGLKVNPLDQFQLWLKQAVDADLTDATAMTIATVDAAGQPSQRIVLLKHADENGLVFYTNFDSKKGQDIACNNKVSLHFAWLPLERQVKIQGVASKLTNDESLQYFSSRPRDSQLGAWCSKQSHALNSRQELEDNFALMQEKFKNKDIPLPDFWGGYKVTVSHYEFWQGGANRLHDSFSYTQEKNNSWHIARLAP